MYLYSTVQARGPLHTFVGHANEIRKEKKKGKKGKKSKGSEEKLKKKNNEH